MFRKTAILGVMLIYALAASAYGQDSATFTGKVKGTTTRVADGKMGIVLNLEEYPNHAFHISLQDAPGFGLTNDQEIKTGAEFDQFVNNLEALKGRKVKLSCVKLKDSGASLYQVKALERLNGK